MGKRKKIPEGPTPGPWRLERLGLSVYAVDPYGKGDMRVADVRGWGHLTGGGYGALGLSEGDARAIQLANGHLLAEARWMHEALEVFVQLNQCDCENEAGCFYCEVRARLATIEEEVSRG